MEITEQLKFKKLDIDIENWTISIAFVPIITKDGDEYIRGKVHRRAFVPGEIDAVKEFTGLGDNSKHIQYINSLWTPEVIAEHQAKVLSDER